MIATFPPDLEAFVSRELATGKYTSKEELVCEAVRVLHELESRRQALRKHVKQGLDQIERGEGIVLDGADAINAFFDDIETRGRQRLQAGQQAT